MRAIDLFAGAGGFSTGATLAGCQVVWAANHWPDAVEWHSRNHQGAEHICQDLQQADWSQVPEHDLMLASPCCQGHSRARGRNSPQHDASRSTAWAVVSAAEYHRPSVVVVENVPEFTGWALFPAWQMAMQALGYTLAPHVLDAADHGVPQHRTRLFIVATRSRAPLMLQIPKRRHVAAAEFLDFDAGRWSQIDKPGRSPRTLERIRNGRQRHGDRFLTAYYGREKGGRELTRRIPAELDRDADLVLSEAAQRLLKMESERDALAARFHCLAEKIIKHCTGPRPGTAQIGLLREASDVLRSPTSPLARLKAEWQAEALVKAVAACSRIAKGQEKLAWMHQETLPNGEEVVGEEGIPYSNKALGATHCADEIGRMVIELRRQAEGGE